MKKPFTIPHTIRGIKVELIGFYHPATMDTREDPGTPAEVEFKAVRLPDGSACHILDGQELTLSEDEYSEAYDFLLRTIAEQEDATAEQEAPKPKRTVKVIYAAPFGLAMEPTTTFLFPLWVPDDDKKALDFIFRQCNHVDGTEWIASANQVAGVNKDGSPIPGKGLRSMSSGDLVILGCRLYLCAFAGWELLHDFKEEAVNSFFSEALEGVGR